jgi:hypothetical protein
VKEQLNRLIEHLQYNRSVETNLPTKAIIRDTHEDSMKILDMIQQLLDHHDLPRT